MSKKAMLYYLPFWLWTIALFTGTSLPGSSITLPDFRFSDKLVHFIAYAGVGFWLIRLLPHLSAKIWQKSPPKITFIIGALMAFADELHQLFIPGRDASWGDMLADVIGVALGILIFKIVRKVLPSLT